MDREGKVVIVRGWVSGLVVYIIISLLLPEWGEVGVNSGHPSHTVTVISWSPPRDRKLSTGRFNPRIDRHVLSVVQHKLRTLDKDSYD